MHDSQGNVQRAGPTEYDFDARGNPVSEVLPGFARSATYDDANRLVSVTEADGLHQYILHPTQTAGVPRRYSPMATPLPMATTPPWVR